MKDPRDREEIDPACIQFVTQKFSSVPMGDVAEFAPGWLFKHMLGVEHQLRKRFQNIH